ncbi:MAG: hypothetical protein LBI79_11145 [Nitrososphaerota archaeon]|nr:hypothetical protein [Nitrososphaerota archaeon]
MFRREAVLPSLPFWRFSTLPKRKRVTDVDTKRVFANERVSVAEGD